MISPVKTACLAAAATLFVALSWSAGIAAPADSAAITGVWRAEAEVAGARIPFRLAIESDGAGVRGHFFDGARTTNPSAAGSFDAGRLHLAFPSYAANLDATIADGRLEGTYRTPSRTTVIHAVLAGEAPAAPGAVPAIGGEWIIPYKSEKGENAWRLIVRQTGARAEAAILRIDGDTGALDGAFDHGVLRLSHFAGERPASLEITPRPDHTLALVLQDLSGRRELTAVRPAAAARLGATPDDPTRTAGVKDQTAPFAFAFKDLTGRLVSNTDPRFRHKVVVVDVMGSWCPNCHDEAPFLQTLYDRHHKQGLEVVALDFEQAPDQLTDPARLRAFIARYGLTYTVLLAGETREVGARLPQARGLNAWPTTFFLGRDGRVKATHVGFTSPASGARDAETRREVERQVETLLAQ